MRKTRLTLTKTKVNGQRYYRVTLPKLGGGRSRRFFKDKAEAQTFMRLAEVQQENFGTAALSMSDALRVEAIECSELLQPYQKTLRDAAKFYVAHLKTITGSRKVKEIVADLLVARTAEASKDVARLDRADPAPGCVSRIACPATTCARTAATCS
jgi:hypothetical protein